MTRLVDFALVPPDSCGENISTDALATGGASHDQERGRYMPRKLALLATTIGALLIFAAPAIASAATLEGTSGPLSKGEGVVGISYDTVFATEDGTFVCEGFAFDAITIVNEPTFALLGEGGGGGAEGCEIEQNGAPITILYVTTEELKFARGSSHITLNFAFDVGGVLTCTFEGTIPVRYTSGSDEVDIDGALMGSGLGCPSGMEFSGYFTLGDEWYDEPVTVN